MVATNLSYTLNQALQQRSKLRDQVKVFNKYNSAALKDDGLNRLVYSTSGLAPNQLSREDEEGTHTLNCKCSPDFNACLPDFSRELDDIQDRECIPPTKQEVLEALWENLHDAAHLVFFQVTDKLMRLRAESPEELAADYGRLNQLGAIDGLHVGHRSNRLFLLYALVRAALNPGLGAAELLGAFEDADAYLEYLLDVRLPDFVRLVPLLRLFFHAHHRDLALLGRPWGNARLWRGGHVARELAALMDVFVKRLFLRQVAERGYNVYTAAVVYLMAGRAQRDAAGLQAARWGGEAGSADPLFAKLHREFSAKLRGLRRQPSSSAPLLPSSSSSSPAGAPPPPGPSFSGAIVAPSPPDAAAAAAAAARQPSPGAASASSSLDLGWRHSLGGGGGAAGLPPPPPWWERLAVGAWARARRSFVLTMFLGYPTPSRGGLPGGGGGGGGAAAAAAVSLDYRREAQFAEVQSALERAGTCFVVQAMLYVGAALTASSAECYEDSWLLTVTYKDVASIALILFSFQLLTAGAVAELSVNTLTFLFDKSSIYVQVLLAMNVAMNSVFSLSLVYSTAAVLRDSDSFIDLVLDSVAVFFVAELDDQLVTRQDEEILQERTIQALLSQLRTLSFVSDEDDQDVNTQRTQLSSYLVAEQHFVQLLCIGSLLIMLPLSIYIFFLGDLPPCE